MRVLALVWLSLLTVTAAAEPTKLQGIWSVLEYDQNGEQPDFALLKRLQVIIKADTLTIQPKLSAQYQPTFKEGKKEVVFVLDAAKVDVIQYRLNVDKGWIDLGANPSNKGLYLLEGDTLKICFASPGKNRPKQFPEQPKTGVVRLVLQRVSK